MLLMLRSYFLPIETAACFAPRSRVSLVLIFLAAAAAVWVAGIYLLELDGRTRHAAWLGRSASGGDPACSRDESARDRDHGLGGAGARPGIAIGNILGGIAIQTVVLVALDVAMGPKSALTTRAASLVLGLEGLLVIVVLAISVMGAQLGHRPRSGEWSRPPS